MIICCYVELKRNLLTYSVKSYDMASQQRSQGLARKQLKPSLRLCKNIKSSSIARLSSVRLSPRQKRCIVGELTLHSRYFTWVQFSLYFAKIHAWASAVERICPPGHITYTHTQRIQAWCNVITKKTETRVHLSVAQLVARRTYDRKVVGSIPANAVCFTVVR